MEIDFWDGRDFWFADASSILTTQEIQHIAKDVRKVIYEKAVAQKIFPTRQIGRGKREFKYAKAVEPSAPRFTQDFTDESKDKILKNELTEKLIGIEKDYFLGMVDIDASRNAPYYSTKIDSLHLREMVALIAEFKERVVWRGYDIKGADPGALDTGVNGIFNDADVQTASSGAGADSKTGESGDFPATVGTFADKLLAKGFYPPYVLVMSSDLFAQMQINQNDTTKDTDQALVMRMKGDQGNQLISNILISNHLVKEDPDRTGAANGAIALICPKAESSEHTIEIVESYPLWHYPLRTSKLGIAGKVLWMGKSVVYESNAIVVDTSVDPDGTT